MVLLLCSELRTVLAEVHHLATAALCCCVVVHHCKEYEHGSEYQKIRKQCHNPALSRNIRNRIVGVPCFCHGLFDIVYIWYIKHLWCAILELHLKTSCRYLPVLHYLYALHLILVKILLELTLCVRVWCSPGAQPVPDADYCKYNDNVYAYSAHTAFLFIQFTSPFYFISPSTKPM